MKNLTYFTREGIVFLKSCLSTGSVKLFCYFENESKENGKDNSQGSKADSMLPYFMQMSGLAREA